MDAPSNMYDEAKTWNPFKGCAFDCVYCTPSFQKQSKRQKRLCQNCYTYTPHCHEDRLSKIPSGRIIFVCGNADISFCPLEFAQRIIQRIVEHNARAAHRTYYLQSKRPVCFEPLLASLPNNVILLTTLETNRDEGYDASPRLHGHQSATHSSRRWSIPGRSSRSSLSSTLTYGPLQPGFAASDPSKSGLASTASRNR